MLEKYLDINSYTDQFSVEDWNKVIKDIFLSFFHDETIFLEKKDLLRTELVNYIPLTQEPRYVELFEYTHELFKVLGEKSKSDLENVFYEHFDKIVETDDYWTRSCLSQADIKNLQPHDIINVKFKAIEDILEGCFKARFKLFFHVNCFLNNIPFQKKDFGQYISDFENPNEIFELYLFDPYLKIKTSQWRNIASHKTYKIRKNHLEIVYSKKNPIKVDLTYAQFEDVFNWVKLMYGSLRLAEVITFLGNRNIIEKVTEKAQNINLRLEQMILQIVHNMQIVGFPFVKIIEDGKTLTLLLNKKQEGDLKESVIHASQCLDLMAYGIHSDEFSSGKYKYAKVVIVSNNLIELASAWIKISDIFDGDTKNNLIDCVKFKIGDAVF